MTATTTPAPRRALRRGATLLGTVTASIALIAGAIGVTSSGSASALNDGDWLGIVNAYRGLSGLSPVAPNSTWSSEAYAHSCYMLQNGISHDEIPGRPGYTAGGDVAGNSGNVAVSSSIGATARNHIDLWMTGPFHAIGVLRHNLTASGFGLCAMEDTPTPWHSGGTLDVIRGLDYSRPRPSSPIVFPGNGSTVPLYRFITEYPNPMTLCGWTGNAGLPLIAMMPNDVTSANSTITGPSGPISTCTLHKGNTGADGTARAILDGENAVVVMPRQELADGTYTVTVNSNGGNVTWSFTVDRDAPLGTVASQPETTKPPIEDTKPASASARFAPVAPFRQIDSRTGQGTVRLQAGRITKIAVADAGAVAVSANFVAVQPDDRGYITAYNCTTELPTVSTINYGPSRVVANQTIVPLQKGAMCLYSLKSTDIVIDVNGYYRTSGGSGFVPTKPKRLHDSRTGMTKLRANDEIALQITGVYGGAPAGASGVALNVTAAEPAGRGYLKVYPCGSVTAAEISSVNFSAGEARPNAVVTPVDASGRVCIRSMVDTHVVVDFTGYFTASGGFDFVPLDPIRVFDSRSRVADLNSVTNGNRVGPGNVVRLDIAGLRGIPASAKAVSVNLTATDATERTYLTAYPCGARPDTSNLNIAPGHPATANGAMLKLSAEGELCVYAHKSVHLIVDVNGVWS